MTTDHDATDLTRRHLRFGWATLFVFALLGLALESMHAFKWDGYLTADHETRRLLWRLGHAHGTLLALVHLGFAATIARAAPRPWRLASACLQGASIALPGGFLLGGIDAHDGDPGIGIALVPLGAILLLVAAGAIWAALGARNGTR